MNLVHYVPKPEHPIKEVRIKLNVITPDNQHLDFGSDSALVDTGTGVIVVLVSSIVTVETCGGEIDIWGHRAYEFEHFGGPLNIKVHTKFS